MRTIQFQLSEKEYKKIQSQVRQACAIPGESKMVEGWQDKWLDIVAQQLKIELIESGLIEDLAECDCFESIVKVLD